MMSILPSTFLNNSIKTILVICVCLCLSLSFSQVIEDHSDFSSPLSHSTPFSFSPAAEKDRIVKLPGEPNQLKINKFGGYLDIRNGARSIYYHFFTSEHDMESDPVVLITSGGPGCSAESYSFSEVGPYVINYDGTLSARLNRYTRRANLLFFDQPAGVGFSIDRTSHTWTDAEAAQDAWLFLQAFYVRFPEFTTNPQVYLSESYGGHYLPHMLLYTIRMNKRVSEVGEIVEKLSNTEWNSEEEESLEWERALGEVEGVKVEEGEVIHQETGFNLLEAIPINTMGLHVGNPLINMWVRNWGQFQSYGEHGVFPLLEFEQYKSKCVPSGNRPAVCGRLENYFQRFTSGYDVYSLNFPTCKGASLGEGEGVDGVITEGEYTAREFDRVREAQGLWRVETETDQYVARHAIFRDLDLQYWLGNGLEEGDVGECVVDDSDMESEDSTVLSTHKPAQSPHKHAMLEVEGDEVEFDKRQPTTYKPCIAMYMSRYFNRADVKRAMHASGRWQLCGFKNNGYSGASMNSNMIGVYQAIQDESDGRAKVWIISGVNDSMCPISETRHMFSNVYQTEKAWSPWIVGGQLYGHKEVFSVGRGTVTLITHTGGGHMLPHTRLAASFRSFVEYFDGEEQ